MPSARALSAVVLALASCAAERDGPAPLGVARERDSSNWAVIDSVDFNFDGLSDVLWSRSGESMAAISLMNGPLLLAAAPVIHGPSGDDWVVSHTADFDGDGMADLLWTYDAKGEMAVSLLKGALPVEEGPVIPGPGSNGWVAVYAADFNADGMGDVLWYNAGTHSMAIGLMAGTGLLQPGPTMATPSGDGWVVVTVADFNADGMGDVLWNNPGQNTMSIWLMKGVDLLLAGPVIPGPSGPGFVASTAADFDADGLQDVLWTDAAHGLMTVWRMGGTQLLEPGPVLPGPGAGWKAATAGDCNADGMADAIWNDTATNRMAVWLMNGTHLLQAGPEIPGPSAGP
jgi:FG-GAP-like repeat